MSLSSEISTADILAQIPWHSPHPVEQSRPALRHEQHIADEVGGKCLGFAKLVLDATF